MAIKIDRNTISLDIGAGVALGIESVPDAMAAAVLAEVSPTVRDQFVQSGFVRMIGRENVYVAPERFGE